MRDEIIVLSDLGRGIKESGRRGKGKMRKEEMGRNGKNKNNACRS
jgi:hypothetical protein